MLRHGRSSPVIPLVRTLAGVAISLCVAGAVSDDMPSFRNVVFYYGNAEATDQLVQFDVAVVEPSAAFSPHQAPSSNTRWLAYVSVGEVNAHHHYYESLPKAWILGRNDIWNSEVINQAAPGWPAFFLENVIEPLWAKGYRGFLDTLDSYQLVAHSDGVRDLNQRGQVQLIRAIRERFPKAVIILNRGFEILPNVHQDVQAVAFESLFRGWDEGAGKYYAVPEGDRQWLLERSREAMTQYHLPVIAIDYCPPSNPSCARETSERIRALGLIPYVGDGRLQQVNLVSLESSGSMVSRPSASRCRPAQ